MKPTLAIVIPTYGAFEYARVAAATALRHTHLAAARVLIIDDASPAAEALPTHERALNTLARQCGQPPIQVYQFRTNGGLTRSWNQGLVWARRERCDYACVTNSDVRFTPGWDVPLLTALNRYALVGPVTNAPGTEALQFVGNYTAKYRRSDADDVLATVVADLRKRHGHRVIPGTLNGFCLVAATTTWWANAYARHDVFRPVNTHNARGQPNPTPLMTLNEYELQGRWHARGLKTGFVPASYVFHYRAVSRGDAHKRGDWLRLAGTAPP